MREELEGKLGIDRTGRIPREEVIVRGRSARCKYDLKRVMPLDHYELETQVPYRFAHGS